jgi:predicted transcriptional regulator YdeE
MKILPLAWSLAVLLPLHCVAMNGQAATPAPAPAPTASAVKTEDQPAFSVIGMAVSTNSEKEAGGNGEIPALWQRMLQQGLIEEIPSRAGGGMVAVYSDFTHSGDLVSYTYTLGVRVTSTAKVPDGFVAITVPAGKYAVVETDQGALPEILPKAWHRVFAMTPQELGGERAYKADYEVFPEDMDWQNAQVDIHLGLK